MVGSTHISQTDGGLRTGANIAPSIHGDLIQIASISRILGQKGLNIPVGKKGVVAKLDSANVIGNQGQICELSQNAQKDVIMEVSGGLIINLSIGFLNAADQFEDLVCKVVCTVTQLGFKSLSGSQDVTFEAEQANFDTEIFPEPDAVINPIFKKGKPFPKF